MNARIPVTGTSAEARVTTVFRSGNSQAVRIPKEYQFDSKEVTIQRRGDELVLKPRYRTVGELLRSLPPLSEEEAAAWDRTMAEVRSQALPLEHRQWFDACAADAPVAPAAKRSASAGARRARPGAPR